MKKLRKASYVFLSILFVPGSFLAAMKALQGDGNRYWIEAVFYGVIGLATLSLALGWVRPPPSK